MLAPFDRKVCKGLHKCRYIPGTNFRSNCAATIRRGSKILDSTLEIGRFGMGNGTHPQIKEMHLFKAKEEVYHSTSRFRAGLASPTVVEPQKVYFV